MRFVKRIVLTTIENVSQKPLILNLRQHRGYAQNLATKFAPTGDFSPGKRTTPDNKINNELFIINLEAVPAERNFKIPPAQSRRRVTKYLNRK